MKALRSGRDSSLTSKLHVTSLQGQNWLWVSAPLSFESSKKPWAHTNPLQPRDSGEQPFLPWKLSQPFLFSFFLAVPRTKILATGGASHNRDILQVSAGRPSSGSATSESQTLSSRTACLCSHCSSQEASSVA